MELKPGQIWAGNCLFSYEPELWFAYVLLSVVIEDNIEWWTTASFMRGKYGASVRRFTEDEIHKLEWQGYITDGISIDFEAEFNHMKAKA